MIWRLWRGWVLPADADSYETRLRTVTFPAYRARGVAGFRDARVLRRELGDEVEFLTVLEFDDMEAVRVFGGEAWDRPTVPDAARAVLLRWDERSAHYEVGDGSATA
jgi:antibiotic biosynthesis monooxygenase (ABM) superfamily enzyme